MQICCRHCCLAFNIFVSLLNESNWYILCISLALSLSSIHRIVCMYSSKIDEWDYTTMDIKPHFHVKSLMCLSINHTHARTKLVFLHIINTHYTAHTHTNTNTHIHPCKHSILCGRLLVSPPPTPISLSRSLQLAASGYFV